MKKLELSNVTEIETIVRIKSSSTTFLINLQNKISKKNVEFITNIYG